MTAEQARIYATARWSERGFYRMLDTMLFRAAAPDQRYRVLERFYRLSPHLSSSGFTRGAQLFLT
ncbi:MAG: hypothetical protein IPO97_13210 [Sphingomonadales bacterium]|nr:hypothetical protein [Sphingomonadales bacterium]